MVGFFILDLFTASGLFFIPAVIVTVATAVFAKIMLFKRDLDGYDYAKKRMFALSLLCFSWLLEIIAEAIIKQRFSTDIFILGAFVLFLICFFRDNPDDTSWKVLNYIGLALLVLVSFVVAVVLLAAGGVVLSEISKGPEYAIAGSLLILGCLSYSLLFAFGIVAIINTSKQPFHL